MEQIIKLIAGLFILFIALSGVDISFRPLKFSLDNPVFGIGAIVKEKSQKQEGNEEVQN